MSEIPFCSCNFDMGISYTPIFLSESIVYKITISLNELDNSDNLEDGKPSKTLSTYFVTSPEYFTHFKPQSPQYKKLKNDTITSLTLAIMDQNNDIITDGLEVNLWYFIYDN